MNDFNSISVRQKNIIVDFLRNNPNIDALNKEKINKLVFKLHAGSGPVKTSDKWIQTINEWKECLLQRKLVMQSHDESVSPIPCLTDYDTKFLTSLGYLRPADPPEVECILRTDSDGDDDDDDDIYERTEDKHNPEKLSLPPHLIEAQIADNEETIKVFKQLQTTLQTLNSVIESQIRKASETEGE